MPRTRVKHPRGWCLDCVRLNVDELLHVIELALYPVAVMTMPALPALPAVPHRKKLEQIAQRLSEDTTLNDEHICKTMWQYLLERNSVDKPWPFPDGIRLRIYLGLRYTAE